MASNYVSVSSHYPEDLPSDIEPGKPYDGMSRHTPIGRSMEPTRNYNNPKHEQWLKTQPMREPNGLSISDTYNLDDHMLDEDMLDEDITPEEKHRDMLTEAGMDDNFVYHSCSNLTIRNVLQCEIDIMDAQDWMDRDKETIKTWLSRRVDQIDNEIKIEKRVKGGN